MYCWNVEHSRYFDRRHCSSLSASNTLCGAVSNGQKPRPMATNLFLTRMFGRTSEKEGQVHALLLCTMVCNTQNHLLSIAVWSHQTPACYCGWSRELAVRRLALVLIRLRRLDMRLPALTSKSRTYTLLPILRSWARNFSFQEELLSMRCATRPLDGTSWWPNTTLGSPQTSGTWPWLDGVSSVLSSNLVSLICAIFLPHTPRRESWCSCGSCQGDISIGTTGSAASLSMRIPPVCKLLPRWCKIPKVGGRSLQRRHRNIFHQSIATIFHGLLRCFV